MYLKPVKTQYSGKVQFSYCILKFKRIKNLLKLIKVKP